MIKFPFTDMQQLNLDWIMQQLHKILQFMPLDGVAGDVLQRTVDGAAWQPISAVSMDIHGLDQLTDPVDGADELPIYDNSAQGNYKVEVSDLMLQAPVQSVNGQTGDVVLPIPVVTVDSVNGQTGAVVLDASDVGAMPDTYVAPVTSVNSQTGDVVIPTISLLDVYPVGSIYMSVNSSSPALLFGGTWQQIEDTFLLSAGSTYTAGDTGGEATHTLTITEMPNHRHDIPFQSGDIGTSYARLPLFNGSETGTTQVAPTGGGQAHNNMPPYLVVYMWKRTA